MKYCSYCNDNSPTEALYCINCGALFTGQTYKLNNTRIISPQPTGAPLAHNFDYYMTWKELITLIRREGCDNITIDREVIYYKGQRVIIISERK